MNKKSFLRACVISLGMTAGLSAADKKINALFISGDDVGAHQWRVTQEEYRAMLLDSGKFDVRISEDGDTMQYSHTATIK